MRDYDVVIIGGGMAGLTAGLFAARYGHSTLVLEPSVPGGQLLNIEKVEDFPGFPQGISGFEIGPSVQEQAENAGAAFRPAEVTGLVREADSASGEADGDWWAVVTDDGR